MKADSVKKINKVKISCTIDGSAKYTIFIEEDKNDPELQLIITNLVNDGHYVIVKQQESNIISLIVTKNKGSHYGDNPNYL